MNMIRMLKQKKFKKKVHQVQVEYIERSKLTSCTGKVYQSNLYDHDP